MTATLQSTRRVPYTFHPPGRLIDFMREVGQTDLINLAAGIPSARLLPVEALREAFDRAVARERGTMFGYHVPEGDPELREIIARRLRGRGIDVKGAEVVTTTGCTQGLEVALSVMTRPGDVVICECPAYYGLLELLSHFQLRVAPLAADINRGIGLETLADALRKHRPRLGVVCSSLSNPTGATIPEVHRPAFVELCRKAGTRILEDEVYAELIDGPLPRPLRSYDDGSTVVYVSSFSKTIAPGLRVGMSVPGRLFEAFAERKCQQDMHSCVVSEVTLREYFLAGKAEAGLDALRKTFRKRRAIGRRAIEAAFPAGTVLSAPRGGFLYWAVLPVAVDLARIREELLPKRIVFAQGRVFFPRQEPERFMRLNCARANQRELASGLTMLGEAISAAGKSFQTRARSG